MPRVGHQPASSHPELSSRHRRSGSGPRRIRPRATGIPARRHDPARYRRGSSRGCKARSVPGVATRRPRYRAGFGLAWPGRISEINPLAEMPRGIDAGVRASRGDPGDGGLRTWSGRERSSHKHRLHVPGRTSPAHPGPCPDLTAIGSAALPADRARRPIPTARRSVPRGSSPAPAADDPDADEPPATPSSPAATGRSSSTTSSARSTSPRRCATRSG